MGTSDGSVGMSEIKIQGGFTLAQDREQRCLMACQENGNQKGFVRMK